MKALVYHGPAEKSWETVSDPVIQSPTDAIVRIDSATICGTDLHILKGDVPEVAPGTILGHEAVGTIVETGPAVTTFTTGDRVLISCITACGRCRFCRRRITAFVRAAADGSSATAPTDFKPSMRESPSPTPRSTRCQSP
jgi:alcohol dehydrogenase